MSTKRIVLTFALLALGACSSTGQVNIAKPKSAAVRPDSSVVLTVDASAGAGDQADTSEAITLVRQGLSGKLPGSGVFDEVVAAEADYTMVVTLLKVRKLPYVARHFGGLYGAVNALAADVSVIDNASGVELTKYSAQVEGAKFSLAEESSFEGTAAAFSDRVIEGLR